MKYRAKDIIKLALENGWTEFSQTGSHRSFRHPQAQFIVTIPDHKGKEVSRLLAIELVKQITQFTKKGYGR